MLFPTQKIAHYCRDFIQERLSQSGADGNARLVPLLIRPDGLKEDSNFKADSSSPTDICVDFHIVLFPTDAFRIAREFWQHTGLGMTSRLAEKCLSLLSDGSSLTLSPPNWSNLPSGDEELYEERDGCDRKVSATSVAKGILRSRIAQGFVGNRAQRTISMSASDVYLYPCGMAAIWNAHRLLLDVRPPAKSVCFGLVLYSS